MALVHWPITAVHTKVPPASQSKAPAAEMPRQNRHSGRDRGPWHRVEVGPAPLAVKEVCRRIERIILRMRGNAARDMDQAEIVLGKGEGGIERLLDGRHHPARHIGAASPAEPPSARATMMPAASVRTANRIVRAEVWAVCRRIAAGDSAQGFGPSRTSERVIAVEHADDPPVLVRNGIGGADIFHQAPLPGRGSWRATKSGSPGSNSPVAGRASAPTLTTRARSTSWVNRAT